jgi:hypothetical protein
MVCIQKKLIGGNQMAWMRLDRLLIQLRRRGIDLRDVTVFVDNFVINPHYQHPRTEDSDYEEDELSDEPEED